MLKERSPKISKLKLQVPNSKSKRQVLKAHDYDICVKQLKPDLLLILLL